MKKLQLIQLIVVIISLSECKASPFLFSTSSWAFRKLFTVQDKSTDHVEDLSEPLQEPFEVMDPTPTPNILHKKAWKLLKKLQLFSALRSNLQNEEDSSSETTWLTAETTEMPSATYLPPIGAPAPLKFSLENGNIGVFFMELFASVATLFTTAAYQLQHLVVPSDATNNTFNSL